MDCAGDNPEPFKGRVSVIRGARIGLVKVQKCTLTVLEPQAARDNAIGNELEMTAARNGAGKEPRLGKLTPQ